MSEEIPSYTWDELTPLPCPVEFLERAGVGSTQPCFEYALPYGAELMDDGVRFRFFSRNAREMRILFYDSPLDLQPSQIVPLYPETNRWGDVWTLFVPGRGVGTLYHIQADGPFLPEEGMRFDRTARLVDPYAKALAGPYLFTEDKILVPPKCVVVSDHFDWRGDRHLRYRMEDSVGSAL